MSILDLMKAFILTIQKIYEAFVATRAVYEKIIWFVKRVRGYLCLILVSIFYILFIENLY